MADKTKQKNTQNIHSDASHIFEVHTMAQDNALNVQQPIEEGSQNSLKKQVTQKKTILQTKKKQPSVNTTANPFLAENDVQKDAPKKSFAQNKNINTPEKINQTSADIAPKIITEQKPQKQKKMIYFIMIIFIILFLFGIIGFTVYFFFFSGNKTINNVAQDIIIETPIEQEMEFESLVEENILEQTYATNLPNYISFDVESATAQDEIAIALATIKKNMIAEDVMDPISFIVTDANSNPVSFHVFAMSAGMVFPQDVLTSFEENFEIYAYNDLMHGIRFGFAIDAKNVNALQESLKVHETQLPEAFSVVMDDAVMNAGAIVFNDSTYGTHPIRYTNLDPEESYSIDYTIYDQNLLLGTSKDTLRAIIDATKDMKIPEQTSGGFEY